MQIDWRDARLDKGWTLDDTMFEWRQYPMPASIRRELSRAKLGRFETGQPAHLSVVARAILAAIYGIPLKEVDAQAAVEYDMVLAGAGGQAGTSTTWMRARHRPATNAAAA